MPCRISCMISIMFLVAMVFMTHSMMSSQTMQKYESKLTPELRKKYGEIATERVRIYYFGYILGFILSIFVILYNTQYLKMKLSGISMACIAVSVSFITNYFYYILSPKTDWMLNHVKTPEETKQWLEMYRYMQFNYHTGLVFGLGAVAVFAFAFRC